VLHPDRFGEILLGHPLHADGRLVYALEGEIDMSNAGLLAERLQILAGEYRHCLEIDMADVAFVDSAGLDALLKVSEALKANSGSLILRNPPSSFLRLMDLLAMEDLFTIAQDGTT
jgi:anti-sigma B factor antagonist